MRAARLLVAVALWAVPTAALADGAFPDELQVFAPHAQPQRIVLATNYGLILSEDEGASWSFVCESAVDTVLVTAYGVGPTDLYALSGASVLTSTDDGCTWSGVDLASTGAALVTDLFGDLSRDGRAYAITFTTNNTYDLFALDDGAFVDVYASPDALLEGVEISQSEPSLVYAASSVFSTGDVDLLCSGDGGGGWVVNDHPELGAYYPGIAAVDPTDAATVYLRLLPALGGGDALAVTHDFGQTITILFTAPGALSAFAVDVDHSWYAGDEANDLWVGDPDGGYVLRTGPAVRCLAARSGTVYACGDEQTDGYILGVSTDRGESFQPLVTPSSYQTASCAPVRAVCPVIDGGPSLDAGSPPTDAGPPPVDAGPPAVDAGPPLDAGHPAPDAGARDGGREDAGQHLVTQDAGPTQRPPDAGEPGLDGGPVDGGSARDAGARESGSTSGSDATRRPSSPGCGCGGTDGSLLGLLFAVALLGRQRRAATRGASSPARRA